MEEFYMVVLQLVIVLALTAGTKTNLYQYVDSQKTWFSAQRYCQHEYNGSLYNNQDPETTNHVEGIPERGQFWTGEYTTLSSWIANIGCYGQNGNSLPWSENLLDENNAGLCQIHCNTSTYFALKGQACVCLSNELPRTFRKHYDTQCNIRCNSSNYFELCGGKTLYSVYKRVQFGSDSTNTGDNCVAVKCHHNGGSSASLQYYGQNCSEPHRPICQLRNGTNLIALNEAHASNWTRSAEACYVENNSSIVPKMESNCPYDFEPLFSNFFWIGIYRRRVTTVVKDHYLGNIQKCTAITKTSDSSRTYNCNQTLPFICQYDGDFMTNTTCRAGKFTIPEHLVSPLGSGVDRDINSQVTTQRTPHTQSHGPITELPRQSNKATTHSEEMATVIEETTIPELTQSHGSTTELSRQSNKATTHSEEMATVIEETTIPELTQSHGSTTELSRQSNKATTHSEEMATVIEETTIPELTQSHGSTTELSRQSNKATTHSEEMATVNEETTIPALTQPHGPTTELSRQSNKATTHSEEMATVIEETTIPELTQSYGQTTELSRQSNKSTSHSGQMTKVIEETTIPELTQSYETTTELSKQSGKTTTHSGQMATVNEETTIPELTQSHEPTTELSKQPNKATTQSKLTTINEETTIPELTQSYGPTTELSKQSSMATTHSGQMATVNEETTIPELTQSHGPTTELSKQSDMATTQSKLTTVIAETAKSGTILNAITTNPQTTLDYKLTQTTTETANLELTSSYVNDDQSSKSYFTKIISTTNAGSTYDSRQYVMTDKTTRSTAAQTTFNLKTSAPTVRPTSTKISMPIGTFRTMLLKTTTALTGTESPLISKKSGVPIVPIAGGAGGLVVVIIIVAICIIWRRKRTNYARSRDGPNLNDGKPPTQRENPIYFHEMNGNSPIYAVPNKSKSGQRNSTLDNTYITPTHTEHRTSAVTVTNPVFDSDKGPHLADDVAEFSNPYNENDEDDFENNQGREAVHPKPLTRYPEAYQGVSHA